jgi:hypothetical protein
MLLLIGPTVIAAAIVLYVIAIYDHIPQAFGGGRPRRAQIEIDSEKLSVPLQQQLSGSLVSKGVIRSKEVHVIAVLGDSLFIVVPQEAEAPTIEITRAAITSVRWLE